MTTTEFLLPNAATLDANGLRQHYIFDVVASNGITIRATHGNTIVIGTLETAANGAVQALTPGTALHLGARANGTQWVAFVEVPTGGWTAV